MNISIQQRKKFRQQAHALKAVILIGAKGLTPPVQREIDIALTAHSLIKIKVNDHDKEDIAQMVIKICEENRAEHIQTIGHTITVWREQEKD
jgi:RNA-binding protein